MPIFASDQIHLICSVFFFFFLTILICQANLRGFVYILLLMFPLHFSDYTCLLSLKPNHRLQILGYDLIMSASAHKF